MATEALAAGEKDAARGVPSRRGAKSNLGAVGKVTVGSNKRLVSIVGPTRLEIMLGVSENAGVGIEHDHVRRFCFVFLLYETPRGYEAINDAQVVPELVWFRSILGCPPL